MTQAIFLGLKGKPIDIRVNTYTPSFVRAQTLAQELSGKAFKEIEDMPNSKFLFLGCKPQQFDSLAEKIKDKVNDETVVISILAGITAERISTTFNTSKVIRIMPSTPSLVGKGISLVFPKKGIPEEDLESVVNLFKGVSKVIKTSSEDEFDLITTISGCGPAYVFEIARIFSTFLNSRGVELATADLVAKELLLGSSKLIDESDESFEELRNKVTSKGGMTFEALEEFKSGGLEKVFVSGFEKAYQRAKTLNN